MLTNVAYMLALCTTSSVFNVYRVSSLTFLFGSLNAHLLLWTEIPGHLSWTSCQPWFVQNVPKLILSRESIRDVLRILSCFCSYYHIVFLWKSGPAYPNDISLFFALNLLLHTGRASVGCLGLQDSSSLAQILFTNTQAGRFQLQLNTVQELAISYGFFGQ